MSRRPDRRCIVLMAGLPGSGKSALALALGDRLDWPVIDKDIILSAMLDEVLETVAQPASYAVMLALGRDLLVNQRQSVILDSPSISEQTVTAARAICEETDAQLRVIPCLADRDTRNDRVRSRVAQRSQPAGTSTTMGTGVERFTHLPDGTLHINTAEALERTVNQVRAWLVDRS